MDDSFHKYQLKDRYLLSNQAIYSIISSIKGGIIEKKQELEM
jgi:hypothetical protein